jgi:outer membrane autotransporter protein
MRAPKRIAMSRVKALVVGASLSGLCTAALAQTTINNQTVTAPPNTIPNDNLIVGSTGSGTLIIESGGVVASTSGVLADQAGSSGTVNVLGTGTWTVTNAINIGRNGTGLLAITGGGQVSSNGIYVGNIGNASGTLNIDGAGSTLTTTNSVRVSSGQNTSGVINVTNGGYLNATGENLYIGEYNDGTLNVSGGSTVASDFTYLGYCGGSCYNNEPLGTANISGAGTTWTLSDGMYIGYEDARGQLNVTDGAVVTTGFYIYTGYYDGYAGGITVSGAGSELIVDDGAGGGEVILGYSGPSTVVVSDGGLFQIGGDVYVGYQPTSISNLTVTGANSAMTVGGNAHIGYEGLGTVTISNGGSLNITGTTYIGEDDYFTTPASLMVTGTGSQLTAGEIQIATSSDALGAMTVSNGANVDTGDVHVGRGAGSTGTLNISGANTIWSGNPSLYAGYDGAGTININGGMVFDPDNNYLNYLYISYAAGSEGTVNISGAGTVVNIGNYIELGYDDRGVLNITGGASVTADYLYGAGGGAASDLLVSGAGTSLNLYYGAYIGSGATLNAIIENGAQLNVTDTDVQINYDSVLEVRNGAQVTAAQGIVIGGSTNGTMILSTGSTATATNGIVRIAQTGGSGTLIFGAREGDAPVAAGTLNSAQVTFGNTFSLPSLSGEIVFNHTGALTFASALSVLNGTGHELTVLAGTTTFTGNSSAFTGDMTVTGGKAVVNSNYSQTDVTVSGSGIVGGSGIIASLDVLSGGTVAPGNSPGTLNVTGNVAFASGTYYAVEVAGAQSDLIAATGTATLNGGTVQVSGSPSLMRYTILSSSALTGTFAGIESASAFIEYSLDYDPLNAYLVIDGFNSLTTAARTPNEFAVARAIDQFPTDNPLYSAIISGSVEGAQQAFNALSGEIHGSVGSALADDSRYVREAITGRLIQAYYGGMGAGGGQPIVMAAAAPTDVVEMDSSSRMSLGAGYGASRGAPPVDHDLAWWSRAFGAWGQYDSNGNAATTDRNLGGFVTGVDGGLGSGWRAGLATGYLSTSLDAGGGRYSSADVNSYVLGGYAGGAVGGFALRSGATWTWNSIDTNRNVVFPGFSEIENASYNGDVGQLFGELAYPIFTHGGVVEPFAGLAYVHVGTDSFTESGSVAGLTSGGLNMNLGYGTLGARAGTTVVWGGATVIPHASVAWQYAFGDTTPEIALAFVSTGIGMGIGGVPLAQNSALVEIGADAVIARGATLGLSYIGQYSGDFNDNGLRGRFNWKF